ncbi:hypothetical protein KDL01_08180 [Actinospica durhamensis]|uniref:FxsC-like protein n=1 Tax=Actinospica durhamensis TaxID=1508375 RepID=A0A941ESW4_9ACTN|nr:TIR-like protein FxsC [Actinospica durhamensis]MBR7833239.1 hypothetical protein [Actinospica durhamensis]
MSDTAVDTRTKTYFFLSYAHTAPLADARQAPVDHWVKALFDDLSDAVREAGARSPSREVGFFDGLVAAGEDSRERITDALGEAEVFVPLCSRGYFSMSWPGREWSCFTSRLIGRPGEQVRRHIAPVLWAPLSRSQRMPGDVDPLRLAPDRREYTDNGLRALNMLSRYRPTYRDVIGRLAREIVTAVRECPLGTAKVRPVNAFPSAFHGQDTTEDFAVVVAAPTTDTLPDGREDGAYGTRATDWRPFGDREQLSLADHAVGIAERLSFSTRVLAAADAGRIPAHTPAVVLIDPWVTRDPKQLADLRRMFEGERGRWTLPLIVLDRADHQSEGDRTRLLDDVERVLADAGALTSETAQRGARGVASMEEFAEVMPVWVTEAERQYITHSGDLRPSEKAPPGGGRGIREPDGTRERP